MSAPRRIDVVGVVLIAMAVLAATASYDARRESARWYAEAAEYNTAITRMLVDHRDRLAGRPVAVHGVAGHSPWSLSAGGYLARILGGQHRWHVFVPQQDVFYPLGTFPGGTITVHLDQRACETAADPRTVHVAIAPDGAVQLTDDCRQAVAFARPVPAIDAWGPQRVGPAERERGFNMYFTGRNLVRGVEVRVAGAATPMSYARRGALMTTSVPAQPAATSIPFTIVLREAVVFSGAVAVQ